MQANWIRYFSSDISPNRKKQQTEMFSQIMGMVNNLMNSEHIRRKCHKEVNNRINKVDASRNWPEKVAIKKKKSMNRNNQWDLHDLPRNQEHKWKNEPLKISIFFISQAILIFGNEDFNSQRINESVNEQRQPVSHLTYKISCQFSKSGYVTSSVKTRYKTNSWESSFVQKYPAEESWSPGA